MDYLLIQADKLWYNIPTEVCLPVVQTKVNIGSGGGVVDSTLDYQSRNHKIDPPLLRSFG